MGGSSIDPISAKKALESMLGIDHVASEDPERDALDCEELREAEYEEMGLRAPAAPAVPTRLRTRIARFLGRRV
jgi:hypothetical protein